MGKLENILNKTVVLNRDDTVWMRREDLKLFSRSKEHLSKREEDRLGALWHLAVASNNAVFIVVVATDEKTKQRKRLLYVLSQT